MIHFFGNPNTKVFTVHTSENLSSENIAKLCWLFGDIEKIDSKEISGFLELMKDCAHKHRLFSFVNLQ